MAFCVLSDCFLWYSSFSFSMQATCSIQKNQIEAGNWLSRARARERAERSAVSIPVLPQWLSSTRNWASSEIFVSASLACPGEWGWLNTGNGTQWGRDKVQQGSGEVRGGVRLSTSKARVILGLQTNAMPFSYLKRWGFCVYAHVCMCVHASNSLSSYLP